MNSFERPFLHSAAILVGFFLLTWPALAQQQPAPPQSSAPQDSQAKPSPPQPPKVGTVIKNTTNLVSVDTVVTDKKGDYVTDLSAKDFRVYEDGKEVPIAKFVSAGNAASPNGPRERRYIVLFFDNASMDVSDQVRARKAAADFIEKTASSDRIMAVVEFGGTLQITQNFTADAKRLEAAVSHTKTSAIQSNPSSDDISNSQAAQAVGAPDLSSMLGAEADFGAYTMLLSLRNLATSLRAIPGRKTLILFTEGFPVTPERESDVTAVIDSCNLANVAVYPLDVRGLTGPIMQLIPPGGSGAPHVMNASASYSGGPVSNPVALMQLLFGSPVAEMQRGGGGGGGGR
ncbi:MAG: VWA domain-containing protein, partial [Candidatus Acidiferrales bacterium]